MIGKKNKKNLYIKQLEETVLHLTKELRQTTDDCTEGYNYAYGLLRQLNAKHEECEDLKAEIKELDRVVKSQDEELYHLDGIIIDLGWELSQGGTID